MRYIEVLISNGLPISTRFKIGRSTMSGVHSSPIVVWTSLGPLPRGYQDRLLGGPLGLLGVCHTAPDGVRRKDYGGEVLG
jgi:hypothetical protein